MRAIMTGLIAAAALAGCDSLMKATPEGWTFINVPGVAPAISYDLSPAPGKFMGTCAETPAFLVMEGNWGASVKHFTVAADGKTMSFETYDTKEGRSLPLLPAGPSGSAEEAANQRAIEAMLAGAKSPIVITADDGWTRTAAPSPAIGKFIATCRASNKAHPQPS